MNPVGYVLDAAAMLRYGSSQELGQLLFGALETDTVVALPLISLAEAYRRASEEQLGLLDALCGQPAVDVLTPEEDDALALGGIAASIGDLDRAHAVVEAMRQRAVLLTASPGALRAELPEGWPVLEL